MKNSSELNFRIGLPFIVGLSLVLIVFTLFQQLLRDFGELDIEHVIDRQTLVSQSEPSLFLSGINQEMFDYKSRFMQRVQPKTIILGSSRSTQIRHNFFNGSFYNLGGAIGSVVDLEAYASLTLSLDQRPQSTVVMIDPWWFNGKSSRAAGTPQSEFPRYISLDHFLAALKLFTQGNWIKSAQKTNNLGIYAALTGDGYGVDGSYHYVQAGKGTYSQADLQFSDSSNRIQKNIFPFEGADVPEPLYVNRLCNALRTIREGTKNIILVAPPFEGSVWKKMELSGKYKYIQSGYDALELCIGEKIHRFLSESDILGASACEFIDGYHGGEIVYARIFSELGRRDSSFRSEINSSYLYSFIENRVGSALGSTIELFLNGHEADFLQIGCRRSFKN